MTAVKTTRKDIHREIKDATKPAVILHTGDLRESGPDDGQIAWDNLIDGNRGTIRFGIANAMDVYRALRARNHRNTETTADA